MKLIKNTFYLLIKVIRFFLSTPLIILLNLSNFYAKALRLIDSRNHSAEWQENLQKILENIKSKKILISESPKAYVQFYHPSSIAVYRSKTLFTKETDTIEWLNKNGSSKKIFYDIGSNLGVYSVFYAKKFDAKVYSFEPSFKNLELLAKNIKLNSLNNNIFIIPNALSNNLSIKNFYQGDFSPGYARATFVDNLENIKKYYSKNLEKNRSISYKTLGLSVDKLIENNLIDMPNLIKIDVDGNEIEIINGCERLLKNIPSLDLLIEVRDDTEEYIEKKMLLFGFKKKSKCKNNIIWKK